MVTIEASTDDDSDNHDAGRIDPPRRRRRQREGRITTTTPRIKRRRKREDDDNASLSSSSSAASISRRLATTSLRVDQDQRTPPYAVDDFSDPESAERRMREDDIERKHDGPRAAGSSPIRGGSPIDPIPRRHDSEDVVLEQFVPLPACRFEFNNHRAHLETDPEMAMYCRRCAISATQSEMTRSDVIQQMDNIFRLNVGKVPPEFWAQMIQCYDDEHVRPMLEDEEDRAKEWYIEMIVTHYMRHVISIEITVRNQQERLDSLVTYMADNELLEVSTTTGRVRTKGPGIIKSFIALLTEQRKVAAVLEGILEKKEREEIA
jgi:hypothetical protein